MQKSIAELSTHEFENIIATVIDRRLQFWLTQLMGALPDLSQKDNAPLKDTFADSLQESLNQAKASEDMDLESFRMLQTKTWNLCGTLTISHPEPTFITDTSQISGVVTNYAEHVDDILYGNIT